jgi:hypothetical protein
MAIEAMNDELTTLKKVLIAAAMLDGDQQVFTAEDVIVKAWRSFPESFGLSGYREEHPDSNRVLAKLMGSLGLCGRGWLEQTNTKTYRLTNAGRKMAKSLGWTPGVPFGAQSATKSVAPVVVVKEPVERAVAPAVSAAKEAVLRAVAEPAERVAPAVARAVEKKDAHAKERLAASSLPSGRPATTAAPVASEPVPFDQSAGMKPAASIARSLAMEGALRATTLSVRSERRPTRWAKRAPRAASGRRCPSDRARRRGDVARVTGADRPSVFENGRRSFRRRRGGARVSV